MTFALIGGTMIDGTGADPKPENTLVVEGTKIVEITSQSEWGGRHPDHRCVRKDPLARDR